MPRKSVSVSERLIEFFVTAPISEAEAVLTHGGVIVRARKNAQGAKRGPKPAQPAAVAPAAPKPRRRRGRPAGYAAGTTTTAGDPGQVENVGN